MKEELLWLRERTSPFELADVLKEWVGYCNGSYLHSALGHKPPMIFEEEYRNNQLTLLATPGLTGCTTPMGTLAAFAPGPGDTLAGFETRRGS